MIRELAAAWVATPRASVHASTGLNMGRQGTLAYWLVHMLSFVTGRLDVEGGNLKSDGFYANARVRRRRRPSRATSTPSSGGCGAARCPAR